MVAFFIICELDTFPELKPSTSLAVAMRCL